MKTLLADALKRLALRFWRRVPPRWRARVVRMIAPKVTVGVCGVILDEQGRILLARHTYHRRYPWGPPGGLIHRREAPAAALARELREECGVEATVGPLLHAGLAAPAQHLTLSYLVTLAGEPRPDGVEISEFAYFTPEETLRRVGRSALPWLARLAEMKKIPGATPLPEKR